MKINSCATRLLAFQKSIAFFTKFERNHQLDVHTVAVANESNHLQGLESKSLIIRDGIGFETNGLYNNMKLQNKIEVLLKNFSKKVYMTSTSTFNAKITTSLTSLEASLEPPIHLFERKEPYIGTIKSIERIVGPRASGETYHIVIDHGGNIPYWEGQSCGIIPPGKNPNKPSKPNSTRLYSLASTRYGDNFDGQMASLCVRRVVYLDPNTGKEDPTKKGICSNFLCVSMPGDKVQIVGPFGKTLILSKGNLTATHIMVATGTGIAPFRAHLRRMFMEDTSLKSNGFAWLFIGVVTTDNLLYDDEFLKYMKEYPTKFRYDIALSREQINSKGEKLYVQDRVEEHSECILDLLDNGAHIYFCGLKEMMPYIQSMLQRVTESRGESWEMKRVALKKNKQWHVVLILNRQFRKNELAHSKATLATTVALEQMKK